MEAPREHRPAAAGHEPRVGATEGWLTPRDVARLRLIRTPAIGPVTYRQLIARFGSADAAIEALPMLAAARRRARARRGRAARGPREIAAVERLGARHLFLDDPGYPALLAELDNAPPALSYAATLAWPTAPAWRWSARATRPPRRAASRAGWRQSWRREGVIVVSGLARGIDTAAHVGALATGTIGVIASGIDIAFPPENRELQEAGRARRAC